LIQAAEPNRSAWTDERPPSQVGVRILAAKNRQEGPRHGRRRLARHDRADDGLTMGAPRGVPGQLAVGCNEVPLAT